MNKWWSFCAVLAINFVFLQSTLGAPSPQAQNEDNSSLNEMGVSNTRTIDTVLTRSKRQQPGCAQVGEYCRSQSDCCSGLCLSFSYKCVRNPASSPFTPVIQNAGPLGGEDLANRFQDSRETDKLPQFPRPNEIGLDDLVNNLYGSGMGGMTQQQSGNAFVGTRFGSSSTPSQGSVMGGAFPTTTSVAPNAFNGFVSGSNSQCSGTGETCLSSSQCCSRVCVQVGQNLTVCGEPVSSTSSSPVAAPQCFPVGDKCFSSSSCCSRRCHNYLHQCVT